MPISVKIELDEETLKHLIYKFFEEKLENMDVDEKFIHILVKSKQNYRSEWEEASFKATYEKILFE